MAGTMAGVLCATRCAVKSATHASGVQLPVLCDMSRMCLEGARSVSRESQRAREEATVAPSRAPAAHAQPCPRAHVVNAALRAVQLFHRKPRVAQTIPLRSPPPAAPNWRRRSVAMSVALSGSRGHSLHSVESLLRQTMIVKDECMISARLLGLMHNGTHCIAYDIRYPYPTYRSRSLWPRFRRVLSRSGVQSSGTYVGSSLQFAVCDHGVFGRAAGLGGLVGAPSSSDVGRRVGATVERRAPSACDSTSRGRPARPRLGPLAAVLAAHRVYAHQSSSELRCRVE